MDGLAGGHIDVGRAEAEVTLPGMKTPVKVSKVALRVAIENGNERADFGSGLILGLIEGEFVHLFLGEHITDKFPRRPLLRLLTKPM